VLVARTLAEAGHPGEQGGCLTLAGPCETWYGSHGNQPGEDPHAVNEDGMWAGYF